MGCLVLKYLHKAISKFFLKPGGGASSNIYTPYGINKIVCMSVCLFAIGRKTVDLRKKLKLPSHVKFPEDEDRLLYNSLSLVVCEEK